MLLILIIGDAVRRVIKTEMKAAELKVFAAAVTKTRKKDHQVEGSRPKHVLYLSGHFRVGI